MPPPHARLRVLTPRGAGGVAVVAVEGEGRHDVLAALLRAPSGGSFDLRSASSTPRLAQLVCRGAVVDQVLVVEREGAIELHLHGSDPIVDALAAEIPRSDSTTETPADRLLRSALGDEQLALALEQRAHDFDSWLEHVRALPAAEREAALDAARARSQVALALAEPRRVALIGARNAGKSTLLNRLTFAERAVTGPLPGLTRDPVSETTVLAGYPYAVLDTAGEGDSADELERRAIALGRAGRRGALCVLVVDGSGPFCELDETLMRSAALVVRSKSDLPPHDGWPELALPVVRVACADPAGAGDVRRIVGEALRQVRALPPAPADGVGGVAALDRAQAEALERA